jgi:D-alanyl-D-alanine dipeptidase
MQGVAPEGELLERQRRTFREMERQGIDALLLGGSTDLLYLSGYTVSQPESARTPFGRGGRDVTLLVLTLDQPPRLVLPTVEIPLTEGAPRVFETVGWNDGEDPVETLARLLPRGGRGMTVAVGASLYSHVLLRAQRVLGAHSYVDGDRLLEPVRLRKSTWEIGQLSASAEAADAVFDRLCEEGARDRTELEILDLIHELQLAAGYDWYKRGIVASGPNSGTNYHWHVGSTKAVEASAVIVDYGGPRNGYHSDFTRTFHVGEPTAEFREVYEIVDRAHRAACAALRPGARASDVDDAARQVIAEAGYADEFDCRVGHGIGLNVDGHEPPYLVAENNAILEDSVTVTVEPGIYLAGRFGVRIEDVVVVRSAGGELLNGASHVLRVM